MKDERVITIDLKLEKGKLLTILEALKSSEYLRFTILTDLFAADFPERKERFEVVYNLLSLKLNMRVIIKVSVSDGSPLPSAHSIFSAATWYEREVYDMFGVEFEGSIDPRRILTDYGFVGHPLRKDFPVTGHLQVRYDAALEKVIYEPVSLQQEFRDFDFLSPWGGPSDLLPGDEKASEK
ncbi:MAG: NADH-quinone oxidoreductase subunit C [Pseudomonadota bacterium]